MCGIAGIAALAGASREWLVAGRDRLSHRGPDDCGEWWSADGHAGLAHRRLSILDLTAAGHQPMLTAAQDLCIAYNGEMYNFRELRTELAARGHVFVSTSDTEVVLAAYREWDTECLTRLQGMFAFGLYDSRRRRLLLARDRAGEKPLFYAVDAHGIRFGSELKALFADKSMPRRIDWRSLDRYLADGYVGGEQCILKGVKKLPPAHALSFDIDSGASRTWRYWKPPAAPMVVDSETSLLDELERVLEQAVRLQLVADVPVGVLLSGGVDSSLITALAVRVKSAVKTFTVRFPGHGSYDETDHARLIARHFGTDHVEIDAEAADVDLLRVLARQFDEPIIDSSMVPTYLVSRVVRDHCTVALGGDGGDELFGGYPHYDRMLRMERSLGIVPRALRTAIGAAAGRWIPQGVRGRSWLQAAGTDLRMGVPPVVQIFDRVTRQRLLGGNDRWTAVAEDIRESRLPDESDLLQRATRLDFETYLAEDLLVKVDRASMLSSLEVRAPMLDVGVIEFAFGRVPSHLKATSGARKVLLKKLAARLLPQSFDLTRKQGFSIPLSSWLRSGPWHDFFREVLLDSGADWFDRGVVAGMLEGQRKGRCNGERLFGLVMFELWRREYQVGMGS